MLTMHIVSYLFYFSFDHFIVIWSSLPLPVVCALIHPPPLQCVVCALIRPLPLQCVACALTCPCWLCRPPTAPKGPREADEREAGERGVGGCGGGRPPALPSKKKWLSLSLDFVPPPCLLSCACEPLQPPWAPQCLAPTLLFFGAPCLSRSSSLPAPPPPVPGRPLMAVIC
jgi:hypothetical protein